MTCTSRHISAGEFTPDVVSPTEPGQEHDFRLAGDAGPMTTVFLLIPLTDTAKEWVTENVSKEGYQPDFPNRLHVEHRFIDMLLEGIAEAGLTVDVI